MTANNNFPELHLISLHQRVERFQTLKLPHIRNAFLNEATYDNKHQIFKVLRWDKGISTLN